MMANLIPDSPLDTFADVSIMRSNALRSVSFNGENDLSLKTSASDPLPSDAREAELLLSFTSIAEKEIRSMGSPARLWDDDEEDLQAFPRLPNFGGAPSTSATLAGPRICSLKKPLTRTWFPLVQPRLASPMATSSTTSTEEDFSDSAYHTDESSKDEGSWKRLRSVSIDSPVPESPKVIRSLTSGTANLVTPLTTPVLVRGLKLPMRKARLRQAQRAKKERRPSNAKKTNTTAVVAPPLAADAADDKKRSLKAVVVPKGKVVKTILRKKFSWKNYPELEAFLIANREEYLRHSALNYTVQQKQYNNRLTERLLELAGEHGYVFDDVEFSFVTVRDRIRCYFKSYVQSAKKKGIIIGYAARKAGLLSTDELEESAHTKGKIMG